MSNLPSLLFVLLGGFCGGVTRFFVSGVVGRRIGETFPWGTLVVNVSGCACIGLLAGLGDALGGTFASASFRDFCVVGFCGGYTTVSSFSLQTLSLGQEGELAWAAGYVVVSTGLGLLAVAAGFQAAAAIAG